MARIKKSGAADDRKIAVYVRKSKITETGKSIEIQKEKCIALACANFDVDEKDIIVYEDEGKSGFYADRPKYKLMLKDIEDNKIRAVVCYKIDRISRRTIDLLNLVQQMEQKDIAFISVSDREIDTSSRTGKIMIALLSAIAEFERDIIAERIMDNMYELAKEGRWLGGICPLGYSSKKEHILVCGKKTTVNHLEPVEDAQRIVKKIFELFLQNRSLTGTVSALNNKGFLTQNKKRFSLTAVKNILQNPVYAIADDEMRGYFSSFDVSIWADEEDFDGRRGIMAYNKTEQFKEIGQESRALDPKYTQRVLRRDIKEWIVSVGKHRGIISGADWITAQNTIAEIAYTHTNRPKLVSRALLSGLLRCVVCGNRMIVRPESGRDAADGSRKFRYVCEKKVYEKEICDASPNVRGNEIDTYVVKEICSISTRENVLRQELFNTKNTLLIKSKESEKEINRLKKRIIQIEEDIQQQVSNLRTAPESVKDVIFADIENLTNEQSTAEQRLESLRESSQSHDEQILDIEKAKQTILDFPKLIELMDYEGKLQLLRRVLECVIVKGDIVHIFLKGTKAPDTLHECHVATDSK